MTLYLRKNCIIKESARAALPVAELPDQAYVVPSLYALILLPLVDFPLEVGASYVHEPFLKYPSTFPDGGQVTWSQGEMSAPGQFRISYPDIRWSSIRDTQGWAGLQHHSVLRATVTISPPDAQGLADGTKPALPHSLAVAVQLGSFFTIIPRSEGIGSESAEVAWYPGDIYALGGSPHLIPLPSNPSQSSAIVYDIFISVDYEIRLSGDPHAYPVRSDVPVSFVDVSVALDYSKAALEIGENNVVPDVVDGWMLGDALGVELKSTQGDWTVEGVGCTNCVSELHCDTSNIQEGDLTLVLNVVGTGDVCR